MHPISFILPLQPNTDLVSSLTANPPSTADPTGAVRLINGNVECTSCHNPHVQNIDPNNPNFLVINNSNSALCLACHSSMPTGSGMGLANALEASHGMMRAFGAPLTRKRHGKQNQSAGRMVDERPRHRGQQGGVASIP